MLALAYAVWIVLNGKITDEILLLGAPIAFLAWVFAKGFLSWNLKKELCFYTMLPMIAALKRDNIKKVGLLGTKFTMTQDFIKNTPIGN